MKCKIIILGFAFVIILFVLIILLTVLRSSEHYEINNWTSLFFAANLFYSSEMFFSYFLQNLEITYTYFHTINAMEIWDIRKLEYLYGSSYLKSLLVLFPREVFEFKPQKASYWYTLFYDKSYRLAGGSWALSMFSEAYINFKFFGSLALVAILRILDYLFYKTILTSCRKGYLHNIVKLYFMVAILEFARGAGLETVVVFMCIVTFISALIQITLRY